MNKKEIYCNLCRKKIDKNMNRFYKGKCSETNESLYWCKNCEQTAILVVFGSKNKDGNWLWLVPTSPEKIIAYSAIDFCLYYGTFEANCFEDNSWNFQPSGDRLYYEYELTTIKKILQFLKIAHM